MKWQANYDDPADSKCFDLVMAFTMTSIALVTPCLVIDFFKGDWRLFMCDFCEIAIMWIMPAFYDSTLRYLQDRRDRAIERPKSRED